MVNTPGPRPCKPGPFSKLGDEELKQILEFCFISYNQHHLRLVNKQLARLALSFTLRTLAICSPNDLQRLINSPEGPLFSEELSKHVLCLEIRFPLHDFVLNSEELPKMCPNLIVVRFRFDLGVDVTKLPVDDVLQRVIAHDSAFAEKRHESHQTWLQFLSKFNPKKFEWVASDNQTLRLIGVHKHLRQLFSSWENLELVFLDGICLLEDHEKQWRVWLPVNTVAIRGPFYDATLSFLYKISRIQASPSCHLLMLESCDDAYEMQQQFAHGVPAVSLLDNTLVATVGWTYAERDLLVTGLTRHKPRSSRSNFWRATAQMLSTTGIHVPLSASMHIPCEFVIALIMVAFCLACHVFLVAKVTSFKTEIAHIPSSRLDRFMFPHLPRVSTLLKASKATAGPSDELSTPIRVLPTPSSNAMEPMAIPSCWCACDQSLPNMKRLVYSQ